MVLFYRCIAAPPNIAKMRQKRKAAEMADSKIKCVLDWEGCSEKSELWKQVEAKFNEEFEGRVASEDEGNEIGDFDCNNDESDDEGSSIASDDSMNDFIVDSSQEESEQQEGTEEECVTESDSESSSEEDYDTDDVVSDDEPIVKKYTKTKADVFDEID